MRTVISILLIALLSACVSSRRATTEVKTYTLGSGTVSLIDTTRTRYAIEVITRYERDTVVETIYRKTGEELRGITYVRDTLYIHARDTVYTTKEVAVNAPSTGRPVWVGLALGTIVLAIIIVIARIKL